MIAGKHTYHTFQGDFLYCLSETPLRYSDA